MTDETNCAAAIGETQYSKEEVWTAINEVLQEHPFVRTKDVADRVGCDRETARVKLHDLEADGQLVSMPTGASAKVWYPAEYAPDVHATIRDPSATEQTETGGDSAPGQSGSAPGQKASAPDQTGEERVLFFPSRREIAVHNITDETKRVLSQSAHHVDSSGDSLLYKVGEVDVWTSGYDEFEELRDNLKRIVGAEQWDDGFDDRIRDDWDRAHQFHLRTVVDDGNEYTILDAADEEVFEDVAKRKLEHNTHYTQYVGDTGMRLKRGSEADVKELLYEEGYPAIDERRLDQGADLDVQLAGITLRDYQQEWVDHFQARKSGVFVGPSGSGKTVAAIGAMEAIAGETLILVPSRELAGQWREELLEKTTLGHYDIGEYHGGEKNIRPVTIATYDTAAMSRHRKLFNDREWGLVIADECHHAVADTWKRFREIQSVARLGLSATPVRESSDAQEIYTLIGPPVGSDWGRLFEEGHVARPDVELVMVPWASGKHRERYQAAEGNRRLIEAAKNPEKIDVIRSLLSEHAGEKAIVFVDWIAQGKAFADALDLPFIYGETRHDEREELYQDFRDGDVEALIVSRVGDEGIDLPDAEVAILASTMGSSRSQTGQRAGRTMRPSGSSQVYILLTKGSGEADWGRESTGFLAEKGIDISKTEWSG